MIYILAIIAYLGIGGFLAGLFEDFDVDEFLWYLLWPVMGLIWLIAFVTAPFQKFGELIITKFRQFQKK